MKPFSQACENNKSFILEKLKAEFSACTEVLELGSGTGQHACFFAPELPWLSWQTSDIAANHPGINSWIDETQAANLKRPVEVDFGNSIWPVPVPDAVFTANTLHIVAWELVESMFQLLARLAPERCVLVIYGPFNYEGRYTSDSNARFDEWLAAQDSRSAIRDFEAVDALAQQAGFLLSRDHAMPANNRLLVWHRGA